MSQPTPSPAGHDRIQLGVIGCGAAGTQHIRKLVEMAEKKEENVAIPAVCDIYEPRKDRAKQLCGAKVFDDHRKLLEVKELDAILIATPNHWHAQMILDALEAGKDVYCEEPMTLYLDEAKAVHRMAIRTQRVVQVGSVACSDERWERARELIQAGKLGKVVWSQMSAACNSPQGVWNAPLEQEAYPGTPSSPGTLDWDRFLGPAPRCSFDPERYFRFRKFWDYSGGPATELFPQALHALLKALGEEFPRRVAVAGGAFALRDQEVPDTLQMIADYPSEHSIVLTACLANEQGLPTLIRGHEATLYLNPKDVTVRPERIYAEEGEE
ncbi:MAG: Gfo/Idh/MocA family oxidoreductase, partial [Planctomycetes bacterium]|nr:Gfo/Idh/MocA family oxidoreductase [Planctomycetota bacterium]